MNTVFSVTDLNRYAGEVLSSDPVLSNVKVRGEISGLKKYPSGHIYFSLKDKESQVNCVAFRGNAAHFSFVPDNGMSVLVTARASLYDRDGRFQLVVYDMEKDGIGDLFAAFERLKVRLGDEGLFDPAHKRKIPQLPRRIGVVTSPKGAVIHDIIHILSRRFPNFDLLIYPSAVQGQTAAAELKKGIEWMNASKTCEVIILARGGGSMEDLWCFNDESLARAIYHSEIPVISAVGHETDFTICDFVADLRAPTPSAAAELVMPLKPELEERISQSRERLKRTLLHAVEIRRNRLAGLSGTRSVSAVERKLEYSGQRLDNLHLDLMRVLKKRVENSGHRLEKSIINLDALSPLKVLSRGYSISQDEESGKILTSIHGTEPGHHIRIQLADGHVVCSADRIIEGGSYES